MFQVTSLVVLFGLMLCILPSHTAMAQQFSGNGTVYEAARNKIGLIRYCRSNRLLDPVIANQAITAVESGLREPPPGDNSAKERGDRAQQAGEDGFWDAGRGRDVAGVAKLLFRTTPSDLCREWADETLRAQASRPYREVKTITVVPFIRPFQPRPQAEPAPDEPIQVDAPPARTTALVDAALSAPLPPLPEKAPFLPGERASLQRTVPAGGAPASTGSTASGNIGTTAGTPGAAPQSSGQAEPLLARLDTEAAEPLPREQTVTAASPAPAPDDRPPSFWRKWPFNRLGKSERCLMPGCKWSASQQRRY